MWLVQDSRRGLTTGAGRDAGRGLTQAIGRATCTVAEQQEHNVLHIRDEAAEACSRCCEKTCAPIEVKVTPEAP